MERTWVVTGSASGIGAATAQLIRDHGNKVIGVDLHDADILADLATEKGRKVLLDEVERLSGGRIDAVVANAGGGPPETSLQLNYFGALATLQELRPMLTKSPSPRAVAISSIASLTPPPETLLEACLAGDEAAAVAMARQMEVSGEFEKTLPDLPLGLILYATAKRALNQWCRQNAVKAEWAGAGITLNVIPLGFYDTPSAAYIFENADARENAAQGVPLRGAFPGRPEAVAKLIRWLAGPENTQLTGQILYADGGYEAQAMTTPPT